MKFIVLSYVTGRTSSHSAFDEDTGTERVIPGRETVVPLVLPLDGNLRTFKKRKGDRIGTRLEFMNGSALPVTETVDVVMQRIAAVDADAAAGLEAAIAQVAAIEEAEAAAVAERQQLNGLQPAMQATDASEADDTDD